MNSIFMSRAIREAEEGIKEGHGGPFGCIIVKDNKVVGHGHNEVISTNDPTAHGEIMAIRDACTNLNTFDLTGCELYTTHFPCPMCKGAIQWANINKVYYGCTIEDTEVIGFRDKQFYEEDDIEYIQVGHTECAQLSKDYMNTDHITY